MAPVVSDRQFYDPGLCKPSWKYSAIVFQGPILYQNLAGYNYGLGNSVETSCSNLLGATIQIILASWWPGKIPI